MNTQGEQAQYRRLALQIKGWGKELGFEDVRITDTDLTQAERRLSRWLAQGRHGEMSYMSKHGAVRTQPDLLLEGTIRIITVRMDYLPHAHTEMQAALDNPDIAYVSRYALGDDYHKLLRKRLQKLADRITDSIGQFGYRAFVDSAPVMEKPIAEKAGIGWTGKHTNLINKNSGSWFFIGELYTDLPLPTDGGASNHCGTCHACMDVCPTGAIVAPYELDARLCISYLTIELRGPIPIELRPLIGNRVFGCDDCQLYCPWNSFAGLTSEPRFGPRSAVTDAELVTLAGWSEREFELNTRGSAIRRIGFECWLRNIAVALGNAPTSDEVEQALTGLSRHSSSLVREHAEWALGRHRPQAESTPVRA